MNRKQIGGDHYMVLGVQPWKAMESWMSYEEFTGYLRGNVVKYLARKKGSRADGIQDLEKAEHYLSKLIEVLNKEATKEGE